MEIGSGRGFLKKMKIELPYEPAVPLLGIYLEGNHYFEKSSASPLSTCTARLFTAAEIRKQHVHQQMNEESRGYTHTHLHTRKKECYSMVKK